MCGVCNWCVCTCLGGVRVCTCERLPQPRHPAAPLAEGHPSPHKPHVAEGVPWSRGPGGGREWAQLSALPPTQPAPLLLQSQLNLMLPPG